MLKTPQGEQMVCITQPDHAALSGFFAAHWGNDSFSQPGGYVTVKDPQALRAEAIFAIGQHDNGWWEWEADPRLDESDGLPVDLKEVAKNQTEAMKNWRLGTRRFQDSHPYASLLIRFHAYWLYAPRTSKPDNPLLWHAVSGNKKPEPSQGVNLAEAEAFLTELDGLEDQLEGAVRKLDGGADWLVPENHLPHGRLLQVLDAMSLALCSRALPLPEGEAIGLGRDAVTLHNVPRRNWDDRVDIAMRPVGEGRMALDPYPFDREALVVAIPQKRFPLGAGVSRADWHATPMELATFELVAG